MVYKKIKIGNRIRFYRRNDGIKLSGKVLKITDMIDVIAEDGKIYRINDMDMADRV